MSKIVLVLGKTSQIARELLNVPWPWDTNPFYIGSEINIENQDVVIGLVRGLHPAVIVNTAAYTAVDEAESNPEKAFATNFEGILNVGKAAEVVGATVIHISTDYVFDGTGNQPYTEDDPVNPQSVYGRSKWAGEEALSTIGVPHVILRTSTLFSPFERGLVNKVLTRQRLQHDLVGVIDRHICPTSAADLANAIASIVAELPRVGRLGLGTFHFAGQPGTSVYEFIAAVAEHAAKMRLAPPQRVRQALAAEWPAAAARPTNGILDCSKIERIWGIRPQPWRAELELCLRQMVKQRTQAA